MLFCQNSYLKNIMSKIFWHNNNFALQFERRKIPVFWWFVENCKSESYDQCNKAILTSSYRNIAFRRWNARGHTVQNIIQVWGRSHQFVFQFQVPLQQQQQYKKRSELANLLESNEKEFARSSISYVTLNWLTDKSHLTFQVLMNCIIL